MKNQKAVVVLTTNNSQIPLEVDFIKLKKPILDLNEVNHPLFIEVKHSNLQTLLDFSSKHDHLLFHIKADGRIKTVTPCANFSIGTNRLLSIGLAFLFIKRSDLSVDPGSLITITIKS